MTDTARPIDADRLPHLKNVLQRLEEVQGRAAGAFVAPELVEGLYAMAYKAYAAEDYSQAEQMFTAMALFAAKDPRAWLGLGGAFEAQNKLNEAVLSYAAALDLAPNDPVPPLRAGVCLMALGLVEDARNALAKAAGMAPVKDPARAEYVRKAESLLTMLEPGAA